jgi:voltage-gated potassium channel
MWWAIETLTTVGYGDMVPITAAGRILGGAVSIIGIGTLALFSGLITVGFLDQLKLYREQHGKTTVAVSEKTISITQSFREQNFRERVGEARDLADLPDLPAMVSQRGETLPARAGICPHCGSVFAAATRDVSDEPFGA